MHSGSATNLTVVSIVVLEAAEDKGEIPALDFIVIIGCHFAFTS
jgi:hypothetical protein